MNYKTSSELPYKSIIDAKQNNYKNNMFRRDKILEIIN
jgi:hypothetical protein